MKTSASPQRRKDAERSALSFVLAACVYLPILWGVFWAAPALTYTPAGQMAAVSLSFAQFSGGSAAAEEAPEPTPATAPEPAEEAPQEPVRTETRDIFEIFLDSVCLDDDLLTYLIDILKRHAEPEFTKLSHAAARTELKLDDFLAWLGNRELLGSTDEQACVRIMDGCLSRLMAEGQTELAAALLSGDETTFKLFRTQAPELVHLPDATYEWYAQNYLDRYYPVRFILRMNGVVFPELTQKEE